jgi:plasmid stabilization system protein ParE
VKVRFSARADREIDEIIVYIATDKAGAAQGVLDRIKAAAGLLVQFPRLGRSIGRNEMSLGVPQTPYSLVYRITSREVLILRIRHSAQNRR